MSSFSISSHKKPIHAPGAVQGFGVLIAVEEDDNTGNLVVRQVSEVRISTYCWATVVIFVTECNGASRSFSSVPF